MHIVDSQVELSPRFFFLLNDDVVLDDYNFLVAFLFLPLSLSRACVRLELIESVFFARS